jgi:hypothetical protein
MGRTLHLRLPVPLTDELVRRLCARLRDELTTGTAAAVVCTVDPAADDLATVDAVARLALAARRAGVDFRLDGADGRLSSLLGLVGLRAALTTVPDDA